MSDYCLFRPSALLGKALATLLFVKQLTEKGFFLTRVLVLFYKSPFSTTPCCMLMPHQKRVVKVLCPGQEDWIQVPLGLIKW